MTDNKNLSLVKKEGEVIASKIFAYFEKLRDYIIKKTQIIRLKLDVREFNKEKELIINELGNDLYKLKLNGKINLPEVDSYFHEIDEINKDIQKTNDTIHKLILS